ncbi:hypothetical protein [Eisenbergiella tayi]|uniref:Uncharacterized protein n=1 Tax=Eisenbergiella tayi TaxID=1432052 RepID=A0A1E3A4C9_9FIRM|nr:hypothetical protein [Eisenbergiella tayi]ODM03241.1 hypothetical protein BEI61_04035 [Eisenbergiella tayi]
MEVEEYRACIIKLVNKINDINGLKRLYRLANNIFCKTAFSKPENK